MIVIRGKIVKPGARNANYDVAEELGVSVPAWSNSSSTISGYFADQADTTYDPKLIVTHAEATATFIPTMIIY